MKLILAAALALGVSQAHAATPVSIKNVAPLTATENAVLPLMLSWYTVAFADGCNIVPDGQAAKFYTTSLLMYINKGWPIEVIGASVAKMGAAGYAHAKKHLACNYWKRHAKEAVAVLKDLDEDNRSAYLP